MPGDPQLPAGEVVEDHGGSLNEARRLFAHVTAPWADLSTGINPHAYPMSDIAGASLTRLPERDALSRLAAVAAAAYGASDPACVVPAPGTQILLPRVMRLRPPGRAVIASPTYGEHRIACALAGHEVEETGDLRRLAAGDIAVVVTPNNPDGRVAARAELLGIAAELAAKGGLLVVDEAFMDVGPEGESVAGDVSELPIVVLRSFGKFYGLAGLRLGFALAGGEVAAGLAADLGPWAVSGPALEIGARALADGPWRATMRARLESEAAALDAVLSTHGIEVAGGTSLYRFIRTGEAPALFERLGRAGLYVRRFKGHLDALRLGLPASPDVLARLDKALAGWRA